MINLNVFYALIKISGPDAENFLQGQLSTDVIKMDDRASSLSVICDAKGRIQALFRVFKLNDSFYLRLTRETREHAIAHLKKYSIFSKVTIEACDNTLWIYGALTGDANNALFSFSPFKGAQELYFTESQIADENTNDWQIKRIQSGTPELYQNTIDQFLPHYLNLDKLGAISFDKGCYTGQEIIARMHYRGTLKQHLYLAKMNNQQTLTPNTIIHDNNNKAIGHIVDSAHTNTETFCLAILRDDKKDHAFINDHSLQVIS